MSFSALGWASLQRPKRASDKLVLIALADRHNTEHNVCWPSLAWLADFCCLDRKTVISCLDRLEQSGMIADTGRRVGKTGQVKVYSLAITGPENMVPKAEPLGCKSPTFSGKESQKRNPKPIKEPVTRLVAKATKSAREKTPFPDIPEWMPLDAWNGFLEMRKASGKKPTARAVELLIAKLDRLRADGNDPGEVLDQSTERNWQGLFEVKGNGRDANNRTGGGYGNRQSGWLG